MPRAAVWADRCDHCGKAKPLSLARFHRHCRGHGGHERHLLPCIGGLT